MSYLRSRPRSRITPFRGMFTAEAPRTLSDSFYLAVRGRQIKSPFLKPEHTFWVPVTVKRKPEFVPVGRNFMIQSPSPDWIKRTFPQRSLRLGGEPFYPF